MWSYNCNIREQTLLYLEDEVFVVTIVFPRGSYVQLSIPVAARALDNTRFLYIWCAKYIARFWQMKVIPKCNVDGFWVDEGFGGSNGRG